MVVLSTGCGESGGAVKKQSPPQTKPNVVLVVMDTLRADRLHATRNGRAVMPFLSQMTGEGTYYSHAISPCSWTKPAMASVLTGLSPEEHGVIYSARIEDPENPTSDRLSDRHQTLAEQLRQSGYTSWAFQTNANLTAALGFAQGYAPEDYKFSNGAPAEQVTTATLEALGKRPTPFFVYAHYMDPHAPYHPGDNIENALGPLPVPPEYDRGLLDDDSRFMAYYSDQVKVGLGLQPTPTIPDLTATGKEAVRHRYDLECLYMDQAIRRLVEGIRLQHPDTIFIFVSDHGEEFWERRGMGHGTTLHQEQVHVPFIIVGPNVTATVVHETISTQNLAGTLLDLIGVSSNGWGPSGPGRVNFPDTVFSFSQGPWPALGINTSAVYHGGYSYLLDRRTNQSSLFYLPDDPEEQHDLGDERHEIASRLAEVWALYQDSITVSSTPEATLLDDAARERLEALGYVGIP
jgi:arylsulfatase A-like enzyme